jgi:hypothetical protein
MRKAILTKLKDNKFNNEHPNNINEGYVSKGMVYQEPEIGKRCIVGDLRTSTVTEIINDNTFKTLNSTYSITYE